MNVEKIYVSQDFQNNEISNVVLENQTSSNIANIEPLQGKVIFDTTANVIAFGDGVKFQRVGESNTYSQVRVKLPEGDYYVNAEIQSDTFTLEQGDGIILEPNIETGTILLKSTASIVTTNNYSTTFGDGSNTSYTITHNLNSDNLVYSFKDLTTNLFFDTTVYKIDDDSVEVTFFEAPALDSIEMVINTSSGKEGDTGATGFQGFQGPRGFQGFTGFQGSTGPQGNLGSGTENQTIRYDSSNVPTATNVVNIFDGSEKYTQVNASNTSAGLKVVTSNANVLYGHFTVPNSVVASNVSLIDLYTDQFDIETQMFNIDGYGRIKSNDLKTGSNDINFFLYSDNQGLIRKSTFDISNYVDNRRLVRKLTSEEIKTSYDSPITILTNSDTDKVIIVDKVFLKYIYLSAPYTWNNAGGLMFKDANKFIFNVNLDLVTGTRSAYQQGYINFADDSLYSYTYSGKDLQFKTLNENPYVGNGDIVLIVDYTLQNINI